MKNWKKLQPALNFARQNLGKNVPLAELAAYTEQSLFHAHRTLRVVLGETPKQFTLRLRVDHAAATLVNSQASILDIALECGFESHETFCRAFRRRFGMSPSGYRKRGLIGPGTRSHADLVDEIGPCVGLYHGGSRERRSEETMKYEINRRELAAQPVLVVRRRVRRAEIAATIGAVLPKVFLHAQQRGLSIAGYPITRYLETSVGLVTFETGMRVTAHSRRLDLSRRPRRSSGRNVAWRACCGDDSLRTVRSTPRRLRRSRRVDCCERISPERRAMGGVLK